MNIRVDLNTPIKDGTEVVFRSPVDCSQITGLIVYYKGESKEFAFADAHGNNVGDIDHLFAENVVVKVILDLSTSMAFVQNADTNAYLEKRFQELEEQIGKGGGGANILSPEQHLTPTILSAHYEPSFYTTLPGAVADLNAGTTDNADATAENALCAIYTDYDGNTCLTLLSDINLGESITISETCIFKVNGYAINYAGDYSISFAGSNCAFNLRVPGSQLIKHTANVSTNVYPVYLNGPGNSLIGGSISYIADSASKSVVAIYIASSDAAVKSCSINLETKAGSGSICGVYIGGSAKLQNAKIAVKSASGEGYGVRGANKSTGFTLSECSIAVRCDVNKSFGIVSSAEVEHIVESCTILSGSPGQDAYGIYVDTTARFSVSNCNIFADGIHGGVGVTQEESKLPGKSAAIFTIGTATVENCNVFGTLCGINCGTSSTTTINGGLYEGVGHGGIYFANTDGNCYVQNATFKCVPYKGVYKDKYMYQGSDYLNAAAYVGSKPGVKAYADNCVFDGGGPCLRVAEGTAEEPGGGEPIRFKNGGTGNALYASNCTFMGDGKIRFGGGGDQRLYLGFANRVLCEANQPDCVDSTTYKNKVFTSYEEV